MKMTNVTETKFRTNIAEYLKQAITFNDAINVITDEGNAVILSESEYNSLVETLYLYQFPGTMKDLQECEKNMDNHEFWIDEKDVDWGV